MKTQTLALILTIGLAAPAAAQDSTRTERHPQVIAAQRGTDGVYTEQHPLMVAQTIPDTAIAARAAQAAQAARAAQDAQNVWTVDVARAVEAARSIGDAVFMARTATNGWDQMSDRERE